jgi:phosphoserine phosphatase RsbU/P
MLPAALPRLAGVEIGARMVPARSVGGDFYDVIMLGPDRLGIAIGDVSGKGVPAALFMALTSSLLRAEAMRGTAPYDVLQHINRQIRGRNARGMFVTVLYGVLDIPARELTFVRAGHDLPLVWDATGRPRPLTLGCGQPLGLFPQPMLDLQRIALAPGDLLLMYTDGVSEARDPNAQFFGLEGIQRVVQSRQTAPAQALCDHLTAVLAAYHGSAPQSDDLTVLSLRVD